MSVRVYTQSEFVMRASFLPARRCSRSAYCPARPPGCRCAEEPQPPRGIRERLARLWVEIDKPLDVLHHLALERRLHVRAKERALDGTKKLRVARAASGVEGGHGVSDQGARVKPVD